MPRQSHGCSNIGPKLLLLAHTWAFLLLHRLKLSTDALVFKNFQEPADTWFLSSSPKLQDEAILWPEAVE
jgi:hypothetical protein